MGTIQHALGRPRALLIVATSLALFATAVGLQAGQADGARVVVLGTGPIVKPSKSIAVERVTGFQTAIGSHKKPFRARFDARLVAWSIKLGRPKKSSYVCYSKGCPIKDSDGKPTGKNFPGFGGPPQARIAVLTPVKKKKNHYKLTGQSALEPLKSILGKTTTFSLTKTLAVHKGQVIALSVPTWAPALALNTAAHTTWRGSRKRKKCVNHKSAKTNLADVLAGRAQMSVGSTRVYQCGYSARLLYSATLVKKP